MRDKIILFFLFIFLFSSSCEDSVRSNIPSVSKFTFQASLLDYPYSRLNTPGDFIIVEKNNHGVTMGFGGLILGRSLWDGIHFAYDLSCQVEASRAVKLEVVENDDLVKGQQIARCPDCGTRYLLNSYGAPAENGKTIPGLQRYNITISGDKVIVYN